MPSCKNLVSVIIPTYNEAQVIERLLKSIKQQTYSPIETILVDDGSHDSTVKIGRKFTKNVFKRKHAERSVQRNYGAKKSKGQYLLFLDADMELSPKVIADCVKTVQENKKTGAITIPEESVASSFWERVKAYERTFYNLEGDEQTDAARFFTREAYKKAWGYDETITGPEDWDLPERIRKLGYEISRIQSKIKHYERVQNPIKLAKKKFYYGLKSYRYFEKHNIPLVGQKTVYFLRPVFYKNWKKLLTNPVLAISMFTMLGFEQIGGGLGYLIGKYKNL